MSREIDPLLERCVERFRKADAERFHAGAVLVDNDDLKLVANAWSSVPVYWTCPKGMPPHDSEELWEWLWLGVTYEPLKMAMAATVAPSRLNVLLEPLRLNRLIYPDGSIAPITMKVLQADIARFAKKAGVRGKRRDKEE